MSANWMWGVILVAAAAHALRWVPAAAAARHLKMPATFALLYVLYAVALYAGSFAGLLVAILVVEVLLQLSRRGRREAAPDGSADAGRRRRR
jgi:hypothetical protein